VFQQQTLYCRHSRVASYDYHNSSVVDHSLNSSTTEIIAHHIVTYMLSLGLTGMLFRYMWLNVTVSEIKLQFSRHIFSYISPIDWFDAM